MSRLTRIVVVLSLVAANLLVSPSARATHVISNTEEKVNGEGARGEAQQQNPDIAASGASSPAGWVVWHDDRGSATAQSGNSLWSKDLSTRAESRITVLSTPTSFPRVSGDRVVWEDAPGGNRDVFARLLPTGSTVNVTAGAPEGTESVKGQGFPAVDGTKVVWEDHRNAGTTGIDIYMKDLAGGPEVLVTDAPGDQTGPDISGSTVVWTDRSVPTEPRVLGRIMDPLGSVFTIADPSGVSAEDAAISGTRVVWTEATDVKTCTLAGSICGASADVWPSVNDQSEADVAGSRVVWLEGESSGDPVWVWYRDLSVAGPNLPLLVDAPPGGAGGSGPEAIRSESPKIDGSKLAWTANLFRGSDIFWKDVITADQPARANSRGLGGFPNQDFPAAGSSYLTFLADSGDFNPRNAVWATELTGDRRNIRVSTFADFGTAISPPKISGSRVTWSDFRDGGHLEGPNVLHRDLLPLGDETRITTSGIGDHPDVGGDRTAWVCHELFLCVHRSGTITRLPLPVSLDRVDQQVRVSGAVVVWSELDFDGTDPSLLLSSTIHAIDVTTGEDSVLGTGANGPAFFPSYDVSGTHVVWRGVDGSGNEVIYRNTTAFPCGGSCDRSASADQLFTPGVLSIQQISMDGTNVAWSQVEATGPDMFSTDIWLKDVTESTGDAPHRVTTLGTASGDVSMLGDYVYWTDFRDGDGDIYRESISGAVAPPPDGAPPGVASKVSSEVNVDGTITVSWTNPSTLDLAGVMVLRRVKTGAKPVAATGIDDPEATIVFDGLGTSVLDTDVVPGVSYTYSVFTYDEVPNYSKAVTSK